MALGLDGGTFEGAVQHKCRSAGTLDNLYTVVSANTRTTATTCKSRIGSSNGNLSASITASTTGSFGDTTHSDTLSLTNLFNAGFATGSGAGSTTIRNITSRFQASSGASTAWASGNTGFVSTSNTNNMFTGGATREIPYNGGSSGGGATYTLSTDSQVNLLVRASGTLSNLYAFIDSNSRSNATTYTHRANAGSGNNTVSVGASSNGAFEDTTHSDTLASGDLVNVQAVNGAGSASQLVCHLGATIVSTSAPKVDLSTGATSTTADMNYNGGTIQYLQPLGYGFDATEANSQATMPSACVVGKERAYVVTNASSGYTINLRIAGADGNQTFSVGSTATGSFEDSTHTDSISGGQLFCHKKTSANAASQINAVALTLNATSTFGSNKFFFRSFP
jgi:hypothetical protein